MSAAERWSFFGHRILKIGNRVSYCYYPLSNESVREISSKGSQAMMFFYHLKDPLKTVNQRHSAPRNLRTDHCPESSNVLVASFANSTGQRRFEGLVVDWETDRHWKLNDE